MKLSHCKLLRKQQLKLLEYFVLEVTARSAANLLDIQPNSAALYYRKSREIIAYQLALASIKNTFAPHLVSCI
jgi:transposase